MFEVVICLIVRFVVLVEAPFEMQSAAGQCLVQLTTADSVFLSKTDAGSAGQRWQRSHEIPNSRESRMGQVLVGGDDWQNEQIAKLTSMLNRSCLKHAEVE